MQYVLSVGVVLAAFGMVKKFGFSDAAGYVFSFLVAVFVAEIPQVYATFPVAKPWLDPFLFAIGTWVTAFGGPQILSMASNVLTQKRLEFYQGVQGIPNTRKS